MAHGKKARAIGFNYVALEVGDIDEALAFYGRLFEFELRSRSKTSAFIDLGDQFLYPVHLKTRKSFGLMTRKLSVTESQRSAQFRGTFSRRKLSVASANWAHVA